MGDTSDRPAHRVYLDGPLPLAGTRVEVAGDEAHHALAVKRVSAGEAIAVHDGAGGVAIGTVLGDGVEGRSRLKRLVIQVASASATDRPTPRIEVWAATPKGDRAMEMIDQLSQVGAAAWRPLVSARSVVDPKAGKLDRLRRAALESLKQCGRAWLMEIGESTSIAEAMTGEPGLDVIVADGQSEAFAPRPGASCIRLLVGPEGGFTDAERAGLIRAGARACRFGPHTMRIETAAVAACAIVTAACASPSYAGELRRTS